jgi:hypothetical protein
MAEISCPSFVSSNVVRVAPQAKPGKAIPRICPIFLPLLPPVFLACSTLLLAALAASTSAEISGRRRVAQYLLLNRARINLSPPRGTAGVFYVDLGHADDTSTVRIPLEVSCRLPPPMKCQYLILSFSSSMFFATHSRAQGLRHLATASPFVPGVRWRRQREPLEKHPCSRWIAGLNDGRTQSPWEGIPPTKLTPTAHPTHHSPCGAAPRSLGFGPLSLGRS